ncbi:hypothetical protein [Pseudoalteromonas luteoviolacea]|nr:hypothetical protein [Pseudoalteromonas luteoviolacea]AOT10970.1 hypothetical protein S4054249_24330 [Pseudoalteromonas luteoviolacea]AOT15866.1 hypothetical protein S40542_24180 [Pseudoalteromonas luteoviolacea]AOT20791.1 hypothetical protein S4054_24250 [Pseudoalteromonas luteoviolacea]KZN77042.1 hypothetical protein N481_26345 [Pseudoalteromonas luteoviolacea S4047-1]
MSQEVLTEEEIREQQLEAMRLRSSNVSKYTDLGFYYLDLSKEYLHHSNYEDRLAMAAKLNGCGFKVAKPFKRKFASHEHTDMFYHIGNCDGQVLVLRRAPGIWLVCLFLSLFCFVGGFGFFFEGVFHGPNWLMPAAIALFCIGPWLTYKLWEQLDWLDKIEFNRHTGLVRTSHTLLRRPFYVPIEDVEMCEGPIIQAARGGGEMGTGGLVLTKYPAKFWWRPTIATFGGMEKDHWTAILKFMDINEPIHEDVHESIEKHYKKNKNAMGTGPFPESMKKYLDAEDKQINRFEVW